MHARSFNLILLFLALLGAAAGADSARVQGWIDKNRLPLICAGGCPPALALVRLFDEVPETRAEVTDDVGSCLATLIAPDEILTNAHCLPKPDVLIYARVTFPATAGFKSETRRMVGVVKRIDLDRTPLLDYAILRLDRAVARPPVRPSARGATAGQAVSIYTFRERPAVETAREGVFEKKDCTITPPTNLPSGARDVSLALAGCVTRNGDSGGPVLDAAGELVGVVWGGTTANSVAVDARCMSESPFYAGPCLQLHTRLAGRVATRALDEIYYDLRDYFEVMPLTETVGDERRVYQNPSCFETAPTAEVTLRGGAIFFARPASHAYVPLDTVVPFRREPVTYVFEARGPGDVFLTTTVGATTTERLLPRCR